ncbi:MAG: hypothetical protein KF730_13835 [Sphingomonas sp.]|uniref:hypothetical protein n=1 Tax=Sphingomonas sp. TaxID=28214 RepID=UPI0025DAED2B|nr:hypothetical protein [Sphingomonas sp.]MBX3565645.1 hypothetical protein [Sphingomonas sp.]
MKFLIAAIALLAAPAAYAQQDAGDVAAKPKPAATVAAPAADPAITTIYDKKLGEGWQNWSFATVELSTDISARMPIKVSAEGYKALYLHHAAFSTAPYRGLTFLIQGTGAGGKVRVIATSGGKPIEGKMKLVEVKAGGWTKVTASLAELGAENVEIDGFWIQNDSGEPMPNFYVADIALTV